jgi:hypothetical protein
MADDTGDAPTARLDGRPRLAPPLPRVESRPVAGRVAAFVGAELLRGDW